MAAVYRWPVVYVHVRLDRLQAPRLDEMRTMHLSRAFGARLSVYRDASGSEAVIKVAGWSKQDVPQNPAVIRVYGQDEIESVKALVRRPGWEPQSEADVP